MMTIVPARETHSDEIWEIFRKVVQAGDTYVFEPDISREDALRYWLSSDHHAFVVTDMEHVFGTYILRRNYPGRGSHVANASYMVSPEARGKGLGSLMCQHSVEQARRLGFSAIQFNMVVSTNAGAISVWKKHGFKIVGTLPKVFRHETRGFVDAFVMHRFL
jgi:L-amino acid N-acyltransferase YncA